jgi:hypothetical protein
MAYIRLQVADEMQAAVDEILSRTAEPEDADQPQEDVHEDETEQLDGDG